MISDFPDQQRRSLISGFLFVLSVLLLDQGSKWLVLTHMKPGTSISVLGETLKFTFVRNYNGVMGIDLLSMTTLTWVSFIALIILIVYWLRSLSRPGLLRWVLAGIIGGALGNIIDRVRYGWVVDFIDVDIPDVHIPELNLGGIHMAEFNLPRWWVFNVADSFIFVGMFILIFITWRDSRTALHSAMPESDNSK